MSLLNKIGIAIVLLITFFNSFLSSMSLVTEANVGVSIFAIFEILAVSIGIGFLLLE